MYNCKQKLRHLRKHPDHKPYLLTSTQYSGADKFYELAQGYDKIVEKVDGVKYIISPFHPLNSTLISEMNDMAVNLNPEKFKAGQ